MKKTITVFIQAHQYTWDKEPTFDAYPVAISNHVQICTAQVEFDLPEFFSMQAGQIAILRAEEESATVAYHKTVANIKSQIETLQCLEMK